MAQSSNSPAQWGKLTSLNPKFENISLSENPSNLIILSKILQERALTNGHTCQIYQDKEEFFINYAGRDLSVDIEGHVLEEGEAFRINSGEKIVLIVSDEIRMDYVFSLERIEAEENCLKRAREENEETVKSEKKLKFSQTLENGLMCKICKKVIHKCVSVVPCLHRFCMDCLMRHLKSSQECPECGKKFVEFCRDAFLDNIIEAYEDSRELGDQEKLNSGRMSARFEYANGDIYEGEWKNCRKDGKGKMAFHNGDLYEGDWKDGVREGHGKIRYKNGDCYDGEWKDNERNGKGKMRYKVGPIYEGDWKENRKDGKGIIIYANGDVFEGEWVKDRIQGEGKMVFMMGCVYEGHWERNYNQGKGKMLYSNGSVYDGEWRKTERDGKGKILYANGDVYDGDWEHNMKQGKGIMAYENGDVYEGKWINDKIASRKSRTVDVSKECEIEMEDYNDLIILE